MGKKELTLKELQSFSLDILMDVHEFCELNKIRYSLAYGTLIGAIRHKGFIPWDDDVDIIMPRPDYDAFCKLYRSSKYKICSIETDPNCLITFGRVYDDSKTTIDTMIPWKKEKGGVWIDVFPVDALEDDFHMYRNRQKVISKKFHFIQRERGFLRNFSLEKSLFRKFRLAALKVMVFNGWFIPCHIRAVIRESKKNEWGTTNHWGLLAYDSYGTKDYHPIGLFEKCVLMPFEDREFMVLSGYDDYLRNIYGDYMQLPPEEQRKPKQSYIHFYWKNR